jgi:hypothetical protein
VMANESASARDQNARFSLHADSRSFRLGWRSLILSDAFTREQANTRIRKGKREIRYAQTNVQKRSPVC